VIRWGRHKDFGLRPW